MAHSLFCGCKKCNPSLTDIFFGSSSRKSPFSNSKSSGTKTNGSRNYGPNQKYYGGRGKPDGPGHGHHNPNNGFNRQPVSDFLGNKALRDSGIYKSSKRQTPKW